MATRYDPDGNEKRRAKKGERRCGECADFLPRVPGEPGWCGYHNGGECKVDDCAGDCQYFREVDRG